MSYFTKKYTNTEKKHKNVVFSFFLGLLQKKKVFLPNAK